MEKRSEFTANFSHEIRTPLNAILGFSQLGQAATEDPIISSYFSKITHTAKSLSAMLDAMIDYEMLSQPDYELMKSPFHLKSFIEALPQLFDKEASKSGNQLHLQMPEMLPEYMTGDPFRLEQVFEIFFKNCALHAPLSKVTCDINTYSSPTYAFGLQVTLNDEGPGIADPILEDIFTPFSKLNLSSQARLSGMSLGIPTAYQIITKMNGQLEISNREDGGTEVFFRIPLEEAHGHHETALLPPSDTRKPITAKELYSSIALSHATLTLVAGSEDLQNQLMTLKELIDLKKPIQSLQVLVQLLESPDVPTELQEILCYLDPYIRQYKFSDCTLVMDVILSQMEVIHL